MIMKIMEKKQNRGNFTGRLGFVLAAAGSADLKDLEALTSPKLTTWKGRGMIVVRSKQKAGKASITVKSSLPAARLSLSAKKNYN